MGEEEIMSRNNVAKQLQRHRVENERQAELQKAKRDASHYKNMFETLLITFQKTITPLLRHLIIKDVVDHIYADVKKSIGKDLDFAYAIYDPNDKGSDLFVFTLPEKYEHCCKVILWAWIKSFGDEDLYTIMQEMVIVKMEAKFNA